MAFKDNAVKGIFIGIGAVVVAPAVLPVLAPVVRPLTKAAIKGGVLLYERGREKAEELKEFFEDMAAEAKVEMAEEKRAAQDLSGAPGGA